MAAFGTTHAGLRTLGYLTLDAAPADTIDAAAAAGFASVGIRISGRRPGDPYPAVIGHAAAIADLRRRAADGGVRISNVSSFHFHPELTDDDLARVMDTVMELGCDRVVANSYHADESVFVDKIARYAERGRPAGVRIAIEFMRYSAIKTPAHAKRLIERIGDPGVGILVDALHLARAGGTPRDVRGLDPATIQFAQLCDARALRDSPSEDALREEARNGRLYPGDGDLPLRELLAALPPGTEIEYEVPRRDLGFLTVRERARVAYSVFHTFLGAAPAAAA